MSDYHIFDCIKSHKKHISFHTPGHKGGVALARFINFCGEDVTELSYTDDLGSPSGAIAEAQADMAAITGAKRAYITTDGSTSGILSMMYAVKGRGGKIIVPRNSHKSVWNACSLFHLEPVIVQGEENEGVLLPPSAELVAELVQKDGDILGMIALSPDYYGNIAPLERYAEVLHANGRLLLADGAHGAHLFGQDNLYVGAYADVWTESAHKTLPALTQGAAVFLNNLSLAPALEEGLSLFRTTSPSFPIMGSVEFGYKYLSAHPELAAEVKDMCESFKSEFPQLSFYPSADWTKLCLDCSKLTINSRLAAKKLEERGVFAEFADGRYIVFYLSPVTQKAHFKALGNALKWLLKQKKLRSTYVPLKKLPVFQRNYSYLYALSQPAEYVLPQEAVGRMCACNAGLMPPCVPIVAAGEMISEEAAKLLGGNEHTFGLSGGKIKVVKKNEWQVHNF